MLGHTIHASVEIHRIFSNWPIVRPGWITPTCRGERSVEVARIRELLHDFSTKEGFHLDDADLMELFESRGWNEGTRVGHDEFVRSFCEFRQWQIDEEWLRSLDLHLLITKYLRKQCYESHSEYELIKTVSACESLESSNLMLMIYQHIKVRFSERRPCPVNFDESKFVVGSHGLFGDIEMFHQGLERCIGIPATSDVLEVMKREHQDESEFVIGNDKKTGLLKTSTPSAEWKIVCDGCVAMPLNSINQHGREIGHSLEHYMEKSKVHSGGELTTAEVAALRLWTGPMYRIYLKSLRSSSENRCKNRNVVKYVTTIHAINSGIVKLSKLWRVPTCRKVYRGYKDMTLPNKFKSKDIYGCCGGVELGILATTEDWRTALYYSKGNAGFILEIEVGQVDRGADISWLSQFPHEKEVVFTAMSNLEIIGKPHRYYFAENVYVLVYPVRISANLKSKTIEEFETMRKDLHINLIEFLVGETERALEDLDGTHAIATKRNAVDLCDEVLQRHRDVSVHVFNEGSDKYLTLVKEAVFMKMRAELMCSTGLPQFPWQEVLDKEDSIEIEWSLTALENWQCENLGLALAKYGQGITSVKIEGTLLQFSQSLFSSSVNVCFPSSSHLLVKDAAILLSFNKNLTSLSIQGTSLCTSDWRLILETLSDCQDLQLLNNYEWTTRYLLDKNETVVVDFDFELDGAVIMSALLMRSPKTLKALNLSGVLVDSLESTTLLGCLVHLYALEELDLSDNYLETAIGIFVGQSLSALVSLRRLNFSNSSITSEEATSIAHNLVHLTLLESLDLSRNLIGINGAEALGMALSLLTSLQRLNLGSCNIEDEGMSSISCGLTNLVCLAQLKLNNNSLEKRGASALADSLRYLVGLTDLNLNLNAIEGEGASAIAENLKFVTALTYLCLDNNAIGEKGSTAISQGLQHLHNLSILNLARNQVGCCGGEIVVNSLCSNLTILRLGENNLGEDGGSWFASCLINLSNLSELQELDLMKNQLGEDGGTAIASILIGMTGLQRLFLTDNALLATGGTAVANALCHLRLLTRLDLKHNLLGKEGGTALAAVLPGHSNLAELNLRDNALQCEGGTAIAQALPSLASLQILGLGFNNLQEAGGTAIADALRSLTKLQQLHISGNFVGSLGGATIAASIALLSTLERIEINGNDLEDVGALAVARIVETLPRVRHVYLAGNGVGEATKRAIRDMFKGIKLQI